MAKPAFDTRANASANANAQQRYTELLYAISHDLRAPLRHIRNFYHLLVTEHQSSWSEEQQEYQSYIERALDKAEQQFAGLLNLSRIHSLNHKAEPFELSVLLQQLLADLAEQQDTSLQVTIQGAESTTLFLQRPLLQLALHEVLKNAFMYCRPDTDPALSIDIQVDNGMMNIRLQDNGPAQNAAHLSECLKPYRRLVDDSYGLGMGLGLCYAQQALEKLGGSLTLLEGTGFIVQLTLPCEPAVEDKQ